MSEQNTNITRGEWRWATIVTILVLAASCIPAIYGWTHTPQGKAFLWTNDLSARDLYTYIAWMEQSARGHILTINPFTTEPHERLLFRPLLVLGGSLSRLPGLTPIISWQLLRLLAGAALLLLIYRWIALFLPGHFDRRAAFLVTALSSGLGWSLSSRIPNSTDLWVPESITFLSIYQSPHFAVSTALMLLVLIRFHQALLRRSASFAWRGGIGAFFLAWIHPFDTVTVLALLGVWTAILAWRAPALRGVVIRACMTITIFIVPVLLWQKYLLAREPVFQLWTKSIHGASPVPLSYLAGFGLLIPLALPGAVRLWNADALRKGGGAFSIMPLLWVALTALLVYAPFDFQRRLIQGVHIPLSLLAGCGILLLFDRLKIPRAGGARPTVLALVLLLLVPSHVDRMRRDIAAYAAGGAPHYLNLEYFDAFRWLRDNSDPDDAVLSSIQTGHFLPAFAGNRVFLGHGELTIGAHQKTEQTERFFSGTMNRSTARSFLDYAAVHYILVSPVERSFGAEWLELWEEARPLYRNSLITIYAAPGR